MPVCAFLLVVVVVLLSSHVSADASTLQNKGLSCRPPAPLCPFSSAQWDSYWREWTCPETCSDGSSPACLIEPCSTARCAGACVNNYCPNHPVKGSQRCTASCVTPVNCIRDPCQVAEGKPSLCPRGKQCQPDYRFGCGFTCEPVTCTWNDEVYQLHDFRPFGDGCNTCSCMPDGTWFCSKKPCLPPPTETPTPEPTTTPAPIIAWCGSLVGCTYALCGGLSQNVATWGVASSSVCIDVSGAVTLDIGGLFDLLSGSVLNEIELQVWASAESANWRDLAVIGTVTSNQTGHLHVTYQTTGLLLSDGSFQGQIVINQPQVRSQFVAGPTTSIPTPTQTPTTRPTVSSPIPRPQCPYAPATLNLSVVRWDCPSTCSDGSQPECLTRPCSHSTCPSGQVCVDNYCPNYPVQGQDRCTATCVTPVNCLQNPCQRTDGLIACPGQQCQPDYSLTCGFTCSPIPPPVTCTFNDRTYLVNETRPYGDGCNTCSCTPNGEWMCTRRPCMGPTTRAPTTRPPRLPAPFCPFGPAVLNVTDNVWRCPRTCSDGSSPVCSTRPCSNTTCGLDQVCVDNYCPNFPLSGDRCTARCVKPLNPADCPRVPCDLHLGQLLCGTPFCRNDYSVGCNYRCDAL